LKKAILKLKCNKDVGLANILANLLIDFYKDLDWHVDLITAVPMDKKKLIIRGYNQADLISRPIALHTKIPFVPSVLVKRYPTRPQVGLSEEDRLKNVADAFSSTPKKILGKNVLIIDDVVTTGATMDACSRALKSAGANKVYGISIARSLRV
jgi:ComF family protein